MADDQPNSLEEMLKKVKLWKIFVGFWYGRNICHDCWQRILADEENQLNNMNNCHLDIQISCHSYENKIQRDISVNGLDNLSTYLRISARFLLLEGPYL